MKKVGGAMYGAKGPKAKKKSAGPKLAPFLGVTKNKSEPDNPIVQPPNMKLGGGNAGSKARSKAARVKRLSGVRL